MTDEPSNVIEFPGVKKPIPKSEMPSVQEIQENIKSLKSGEIVEMTEVLGSMILETLTASGYKLDTSSETLPMIFFFMESLKALISKQYNAVHPFHEMAENFFIPNENGDIVFREPKFKFSDEPFPETEEEIPKYEE